MARTKPLTQAEVDYLNELFGCNNATRFKGLRVSLFVRKPLDLSLEEICRRFSAREVSYGNFDCDALLIEEGLEDSIPAWVSAKRFPLAEFRFLLDGPSEYQGRH